MNEVDCKLRFDVVPGARPKYRLRDAPAGHKRVIRTYDDFVTRRFQIEQMDDDIFSGLPHELWPPQTDSG